MESSTPAPSHPIAFAQRALALAATCVGLAAGILAPATAHALSFQADFRSSTYQTQPGDSFASLMLQHQAGALIRSNVTTGLAGLSTTVYANGVTNNYSLLMSTTFQVAVAGTYTFQVGTDWGRGGAAALMNADSGAVLSERVITDDIWWNNDWNNPDVFTTTSTFVVGDRVTMAWVGFEGCCGGSSTIRFSVDGGAYQNFTQTSFQSYAAVPEPSTAAYLALGFIGLASCGRSGRRWRA